MEGHGFSRADEPTRDEGFSPEGHPPRLRHPPTNYQWAYEMQVEDLDGNILRLGSDSKSDQPIGEWLDMDGDCWTQSSDREWKRAAK